MKDLFLADAHLLDPAAPAYRRLLEFLEAQQGQVRTLYLLGDIFDFWIGFRSVVYAPYVPLLEALRRLRETGTELVFVEGNHDFHMGPYFSETLGCRVLRDGGAVTIDGCRVYIGHGDLVNPRDRGYRALRRIFRSGLVQVLSQIVHPDWTWGIYRWLNRRSHHGKPPKAARDLPLEDLRSHARRRFAEGCQVVVTGHFHIPYQETAAEGTFFALGGWLENSAYAVWEKGRLTLANY